MSDPDFDQIARGLSEYLVDENDMRVVTEALRQVWNARGVADLAAINAGSIDPDRAIAEQDR